MITCKLIIPCDTALIDMEAQFLTLVRVYDSWRAQAPFPIALPRLSAGITLEREAQDPTLFEGEVRVRLGGDVVATVPAHIDFGDKLFMRIVFGPVTGLVAKEATSLSVELWHAVAGGKMLANARIPISGAAEPRKELLQ